MTDLKPPDLFYIVSSPILVGLLFYTGLMKSSPTGFWDILGYIWGSLLVIAGLVQAVALNSLLKIMQKEFEDKLSYTIDCVSGNYMGLIILPYLSAAAMFCAVWFAEVSNFQGFLTAATINLMCFYLVVKYNKKIKLRVGVLNNVIKAGKRIDEEKRN